MSTPVLELRGVTSGYDKRPAIRGVELAVAEGEIVALLGPNGAGKTTTLLTISGILSPLSGEVRILGESITRRAPHKIARLGVAHVPEDRGLFLALSVRDNLAIVGRLRNFDAILERFPALDRLMDRRAGLLSGGEQQMLAVARALAGRPKLLMIDEMSLGLAPLITQRLLESVSVLAREAGCAVLLVEQHVRLALGVADRAYVLSQGRIALEGRARGLLDDPQMLQQAYLGEHKAVDVEAPR